MVRMKTLSLSLFLVIFSFLTVNAQSLDEIRAKAAELRDQHKEAEALPLFEQLLADNPNDLEANWSKSVLLARLGYRLKDKKKQESYYRDAKKHAELALAADSTNLYANYAMAAAMGRMALISGAKERVAASKDIKKYADRAVAANPNYAGGWHMLARWHHKVANLNFAERAAANLLFGGVPEGASNEAAISSIKKAIELDGNFILYKRDAANILADLDYEQEALTFAREVVNMPELTLDDAKFKNEMKKLISKLE